MHHDRHGSDSSDAFSPRAVASAHGPVGGNFTPPMAVEQSPRLQYRGPDDVGLPALTACSFASSAADTQPATPHSLSGCGYRLGTRGGFGSLNCEILDLQESSSAIDLWAHKFKFREP